MDLSKIIRSIPDFPQKGIIFRDITPILKDADALKEVILQMADQLKDLEFDYVVGSESRGFLVGVPLAIYMHKGFIPVRKPGKLPCPVYSQPYELEYGQNTLEIHQDALEKGDRVVIVDDLIATGGTSKAMCDLVERAGGEVASINFLIELAGLNGRELLKDYRVQSILVY